MKLFDTLESRRLFAITATAGLAPVTAQSGAFPTMMDLDSFFDSSTINGTVVALNIEVGNTTGVLNFELFDGATPTTVANFLKYVDSGRYDGSFFHRSIDNFVLQGGGFTYPGVSIASFGNIANEFGTSPRDSSGKVNTRGTVAMAKLDGDPNSANSQFFINTVDNSSNLDTANGGFTTFARVLGDGITFADTLNDLPTVELESPFEDLPVSATYSTAAGAPQQEDVVFISSADRVSALKYSVSTSNIDIVNPVVDANGVLTLNYQPQATGSATITIITTDLDGTTLTSTFDVTVADAGTLTASYDNTVINPNGSVAVDFGDISAPVNGSVTRKLIFENRGNTDIVNLAYTVPAGFALGSDAPTSLFVGQRKEVTVTVDTSKITERSGSLVITSTSDDIGQGQSTSTVTIPLAADLKFPVVLGRDGIKSVTFTQADSTVATFTLTGAGTATFDFDGNDVTATANGKGGMTVAGSSLALFNITFAQTDLSSKMKLASKGANPVIIQAVTGAGTAALGSFEAKTARLTGEFIFGSSIATSAQVKKIVLGSSEGADFSLGLNNDPAAALSLTIGTANNTTLFSGYPIAALTADAWNRGGSSGVIQTSVIGKLNVKGNFDGDLSLSNGITQATIGGTLTSGVWSIGPGGVGKLSAAAAASKFQLDTTGDIGSTAFKGDYAGTISARGINTFSALSGTAPTITAVRFINSMTFKGEVLGGFFNSGYRIGKFSATSIDGTRMYAGVVLTAGTVLPTSASNFAADATLDGALFSSSIGSINLTGKNATFAFATSAISARNIGSLKSGIAVTGNITNGFAAARYGSVNLTTDTGQRIALANVETQDQVPVISNTNNNVAGLKILAL